MAGPVAEYCETPNPNALKLVLTRPLGGGPRSFRGREEAAGDELAAKLFEVEGVAGLLMMDGWMTVNKAPDARWPQVKKGVEAVLKGAGH